MKITRDMALRLRDIFDEKMFSVVNWMYGGGRSRIDHWLDQLGVKCFHQGIILKNLLPGGFKYIS
jgi:hypothetical protein